MNKRRTPVLIVDTQNPFLGILSTLQTSDGNISCSDVGTGLFNRKWEIPQFLDEVLGILSKLSKSCRREHLRRSTTASSSCIYSSDLLTLTSSPSLGRSRLVDRTEPFLATRDELDHTPSILPFINFIDVIENQQLALFSRSNQFSFVSQHRHGLDPLADWEYRERLKSILCS